MNEGDIGKRDSKREMGGGGGVIEEWKIKRERVRMN